MKQSSFLINQQKQIHNILEHIIAKVKFIVYYKNIGISLNCLQKFNEAIECYNKAIELYPDYVGAYFNKGI